MQAVDVSNTMDVTIDAAHITQEFVKVMSPIVYPGKLALKINGNPLRTDDITSSQKIIEVAKKYKLHRQIEYSTCAVQISFGPGTNVLHGSYLHVYINNFDMHSSVLRLVIIATLLTTLILLARIH